MPMLVMEVVGHKVEGEFALVQYMKCSPPRDNGEKVQECVSLRWRTDDDADQT